MLYVNWTQVKVISISLNKLGYTILNCYANKDHKPHHFCGVGLQDWNCWHLVFTRCAVIHGYTNIAFTSIAGSIEFIDLILLFGKLFIGLTSILICINDSRKTLMDIWWSLISLSDLICFLRIVLLREDTVLADTLQTNPWCDKKKMRNHVFVKATANKQEIWKYISAWLSFNILSLCLKVSFWLFFASWMWVCV